MKSRKKMRAGVILAAICSCNHVICAQTDRSDNAKVVAMLPRNDLNWQAMAWKILLFNSPSIGGNSRDNAMEGRRGEGTIRTEMDVSWLCHVDMYLLVFLLARWYAEMLRSFGRDHGVATRDIISRSVRESWARRRDLAGFMLLALKVLSEAGR